MSRPIKHLEQHILEGSLHEEQIRREESYITGGIKRYNSLVRDTIERGEGSELSASQRVARYWYRPLLQAIREVKRNFAANQSILDGAAGIKHYGPVMMLVPAEKMAAITLQATLSKLMMQPDGVKHSTLAHHIGSVVLSTINMKILQAKGREEDKELRELIQDLDGNDAYEAKRNHVSTYKQFARTVRKITDKNLNWYAKKYFADDVVWSRKACVHTGTALLWLLIGTATAGDYEDNFVQAVRQQLIWMPGGHRPRSVRHIQLTDDAWSMIEHGHDVLQYCHPLYRAMVVPPVTWDAGMGGYYKTRAKIVSKSTRQQQEAYRTTHMPDYTSALDILGRTPLAVNTAVLDVQEQLYESGGAIGTIPHRDNIPMPPIVEARNEEHKSELKKERSRIYRENRNRRGLRVTYELVLSGARDAGKYDYIYLPHNACFRGRMYPLPAVFNHHGADSARSLFLFADRKPLDSVGRQSLMIYIAGLLGYDKTSNADRLQKIDDITDQLNLWANDPIRHTGWQRDLEGKPNTKKMFQVLAAAKALFDDEIGSRLPVQLDGTCNGLQHYAAMGRDPMSAGMVNLIPGDKPTDVYSAVGSYAWAMIKQAASDDILARRVVECLPDGISRSMAKDVVMPDVYGMTMVGARQAVYACLDEHDVEGSERYRISMYVGKMIKQALAEVVPAATQIMAWLQNVARLIAKTGEVVQWCTPLNFPVIQHYRKQSKKQVATVLGNLTVQIDDDKVPAAPGKQASGMAPNFNHCIDATHLAMIIKKCADEGLSVLTVHDSVWTHANDVPRLHQIIRSTFVELHTPDLLLDLHTQLQRQHPDIQLPKPPEQGDFNLTQVIDSEYFFNG